MTKNINPLTPTRRGLMTAAAGPARAAAVIRANAETPSTRKRVFIVTLDSIWMSLSGQSGCGQPPCRGPLP